MRQLQYRKHVKKIIKENCVIGMVKNVWIKFVQMLLILIKQIMNVNHFYQIVLQMEMDVLII